MARKVDELHQIRTRKEMETVVGAICDLTIEIDATKAAMDARLTQVRREYEEKLSRCAQDLERLMDIACDWAERNPATFGDKRSIEMTHGTVGFRMGNPSLAMLRGWTREKVMDVLPTEYVRTKREPDREKLLADRDTLGEVVLARFGLKVTQAESFFVDPKREPASDSKQVA